MSHNLDDKIRGSFIEGDRCLNCWDAPCNINCPAGINISGFIRSLNRSDYISAAEIIEIDNPFGYICGWICPQEDLCQKKCIAIKLGRAIDIRSLQRIAIEIFRKKYNIGNTFLNSNVDLSKLNINIDGNAHIEDVSKIYNHKQSREKIAIIGAGPSGLTSGLFLLKMGYKVVIFEKEESAGGRIIRGIPDFRLPKDIAIKEIESISSALKIEYGKEFGKDISIPKLLDDGFSAVYIAIGKWKENSLNIKGNDLQRFFHADNILIDVDWKKIDYHNVVVIGAGNVALDVARTLIKNNKKSNVYIIYRRTAIEMPVTKEDRENAWDEGVIFQFLSQPTEVVRNELSNIQMVKCVRNLPGAIDRAGRRKPDIVEGYEFNLPADMVVTALGYKPQQDLLISEGLNTDENGFIIVDKNLKTNLKNVFAGGDIIGKNRNSVVQAVADGKRAAINIHKYFSSQGGNIG